MCNYCNWQPFVEGCDECLDDLVLIPYFARAQVFADSVREKVEGMRDWAEEHEHVTETMEVALANMQEGVNNWIHPRSKGKR